MTQKILITYASRTRVTSGVAHIIGEELAKRGAKVDTHFILDVNDVSAYDTVVVGSSIRYGHWLPEAVQFVKIHQRNLQKKKVAYFVVGMTLREDTQENRDTVLTALKQVRKWVEPIDIGLFAGALKPKKLDFIARMITKLVKMPEGDFRDIPAIRIWAEELADKLAL